MHPEATEPGEKQKQIWENAKALNRHSEETSNLRGPVLSDKACIVQKHNVVTKGEEDFGRLHQYESNKRSGMPVKATISNKVQCTSNA